MKARKHMSHDSRSQCVHCPAVSMQSSGVVSWKLLIFEQMIQGNRERLTACGTFVLRVAGSVYLMQLNILPDVV
jgi:hypothetical protein